MAARGRGQTPPLQNIRPGGKQEFPFGGKCAIIGRRENADGGGQMYQTRITAAELPVERLLGEYCFPERFREACRACPDYGNDWSCPPGVPSAAEALRPFRTAHVLGIQVFYDAQTRREVSTAEGAEAVRRASYGPAKRVLLETLLALEQTRSGAWTIAAGRCELCARCARRDGLPCRNPERMRYSFSAFGFDLAALARQELGIELLWAANGLPEYDVALAAFLER